MYDVIIIGAGVTGSAIARELSRKKLKIAVLERCSDVCEGTSKANSGIAHAGFDAEPGTLKAKMNVEGRSMIEKLSKELDFPYRKNGSMVISFSNEDMPGLLRLLDKAQANGVKNCRIITGDEALAMEPQLSKDVKAAFYAPDGGIVCPFGLTIALAENACVNGVEFFLNQTVENIKKIHNHPDALPDHAARPDPYVQGGKPVSFDRCKSGSPGYVITTQDRVYYTRLVVNAAGVYADKLHNMVSSEKMTITPRKGEYCLMDRKAGGFVNSTIFQLPTKLGKGVLVTPTIHGNLMAGPTAADASGRESVDTTSSGMQLLLKTARMSTPDLPSRQVITSFAGLRAHADRGDFILEQAPGAPGFIDAAGIESPGLTSAPAIGKYIAALVNEILPSEDKGNFIPDRKGIPCMRDASFEEKQRLIAGDPSYANVICRCETITEGEILAAIHRPLGATTLDGVKRRTRAGMGRCQSGFCSPKVAEILSRELGCDIGEITKKGGDSYILTGFNKD